jgi:tRNA(Ile)-lysidine synthase
MGRDGRPLVVRRIAAFLGGLPGVPPGSHLLVACSGGPDSTALVAGLAECAAAHPMRLTLVHLRHGLRGLEDEDRDEAFVRQLADRLGVEVSVQSLGVIHGPNLEARARSARRRALQALARTSGATHVALGHTLDDQAETVLLRLLRGGGRGGIAGMRPHAGMIVRPLLRATRADVRWYLADRGIVPVLDRSNADLRHSRNRVRRVLLPLLAAEFNPRVSAALGELAVRLRDEDDLLAALARDRGAAMVHGEELDCAVAALPAALGRRVVASWLAGQGIGAATAVHIERVRRAAGRPPMGDIVLPGGRCVRREGDRLRCATFTTADALARLEVIPGAVVHGASWSLEMSLAHDWPPGADARRPSDVALLDADALPGPLAVRAPQTGDRVRIYAVGTRKLHDVLIDRKVPRRQRRALPVLVAGDEVVWVPGVVRSAAARVVDGTRRVLEARWRSDDKVALPLQKPCGNLSPRAECTERGSIE